MEVIAARNESKGNNVSFHAKESQLLHTNWRIAIMDHWKGTINFC